MTSRDRDDPPRRVILLRHGRTAWNAQGRWQGREDVPLDAVGLRQAERAAEVLVREGGISRLVTSPARRAAQTAAVLRGAFDLAGRPLVRTHDERLLEVDVGAWSGLTHDEVAQRFGSEYAAVLDGEDVPYGVSGERLSEASRRVRDAVVSAMGGVPAGESLLVVTHGAVLRGAVADLCGIPMEVFKRSFVSVGNCHWVTIVEQGGAWAVESWNVSS